MHTGDVIKYLRKRNGITQEQLANLVGLKKSSVQKYENGKVQNLKLKILQKLCKIFRTSPYVFVFPKLWQKIHIQKHTYNEMEQLSMMTYFNLSDKGKEKVLEYIADIGEIEKYKRSNSISLKEHWLFSAK